MTDKMNFGLIGVGVMGQNLTLNMERNGFSVVVYDRALEKVTEFLQGKAKGKRIAGAPSVEAFLRQLDRPRRIILLVNAGKPVDDVLDQLEPFLENGDVVIDGGNSFFMDTERRALALERNGIYFVGSGVSGGEEGALKGPSIMPGGAKEAYDLIAPVLTKIAAQVDGKPCCAYMGPRGAGHYVKMVHNGIEYAIMQLICEAYDIIRSGMGLSAPEISLLFKEWNRTDLNSYLFEVTSKVLSKMDAGTNKPLVDFILDTAEQKGTGKWTSQNAFDLGIPIPTINAAVESRMLSSFKEQRKRASRSLRGPASPSPGAESRLVTDVHDALHASIIVSYAQGMSLLQASSAEYKYDLKLDKIAEIWRGGCIIRAKILEPIRAAYAKTPSPANMVMDEYFSSKLNELQEPWRRAVGMAVRNGIPTTAMSASLAYYDAYRRERLPANLLQAQRDYFGAHTYRRIDKDGVFHTQWDE
ncbi:MAG: NADP-dependent phosphogluconate dehydrogenase [Bacteroidota bacterium]|jgi:6-phosphogluconate dehydrogenase